MHTWLHRWVRTVYFSIIYHTKLSVMCQLYKLFKKDDLVPSISNKSWPISDRAVLPGSSGEDSWFVFLVSLICVIWRAPCINFVYVGYPRVIRADYGTENCAAAKIHIAFINDYEAGRGQRSVFYGPSTANIVSMYNRCHWFVVVSMIVWLNSE